MQADCINFQDLLTERGLIPASSASAPNSEYSIEGAEERAIFMTRGYQSFIVETRTSNRYRNWALLKKVLSLGHLLTF